MAGVSPPRLPGDVGLRVPDPGAVASPSGRPRPGKPRPSRRAAGPGGRAASPRTAAPSPSPIGSSPAVSASDQNAISTRSVRPPPVIVPARITTARSSNGPNSVVLAPHAGTPSPARAPARPKSITPSNGDSRPRPPPALREELRRVASQDLPADPQGVPLEQLAPLELLRQHLGEHPLGHHGGLVGPLTMVLVVAAHQPVGGHHLQQLVQGPPRHRRADGRQPDRVAPDV